MPISPTAYNSAIPSLLGSLFCLLGWALELAAVSFIDPKTGLGWAGQRYAGMFCISIGESISIPALVTWLSNNLRGRKERVVGLATLLGGAQAGNFVSASVYYGPGEDGV